MSYQKERKFITEFKINGDAEHMLNYSFNKSVCLDIFSIDRKINCSIYAPLDYIYDYSRSCNYKSTEASVSYGFFEIFSGQMPAKKSNFFKILFAFPGHCEEGKTVGKNIGLILYKYLHKKRHYAIASALQTQRISSIVELLRVFLNCKTLQEAVKSIYEIPELKRIFTTTFYNINIFYPVNYLSNSIYAFSCLQREILAYPEIKKINHLKLIGKDNMQITITKPMAKKIVSHMFRETLPDTSRVIDPNHFATIISEYSRFYNSINLYKSYTFLDQYIQKENNFLHQLDDVINLDHIDPDDIDYTDYCTVIDNILAKEQALEEREREKALSEAKQIVKESTDDANKCFIL